jgi:hypothetical protein
VIWAGFPMLFSLLAMAVLLLPAIFYILTLRRALEQCVPESRTMAPDLIWFLLIPLFGLFWHFYVVVSLSRSLGNEYRKRAIATESSPGLGLGLAVCILGVITLTPSVFFRIPAAIAALICWVLYWLKVGDLTAKLTGAPPPATGP